MVRRFSRQVHFADRVSDMGPLATTSSVIMSPAMLWLVTASHEFATDRSP
jgi:hypothetical protein